LYCLDVDGNNWIPPLLDKGYVMLFVDAYTFSFAVVLPEGMLELLLLVVLMNWTFYPTAERGYCYLGTFLLLRGPVLL